MRTIPRPEERGAAFVTVAWLILLLALVVSGLLAGSLSARKILSAERTLLSEQLVLQSVTELFLARHLVSEDGTVVLSGSVLHDGRSFTVTVSFDDGRININRAGPDLLSALFAAQGLREEAADRLADQIVDWRDPDGNARPLGAEAAAYTALDRGGAPRNGPFERVGELRFLPAMDDALFRCIADLVTVASLVPDVALDRASSDVRSVYRFAYEKGWKGVVWPNPDSLTVVESVAGNDEFFSGKTVRLRVFSPDRPSVFLETMLRINDLKGLMFSPIGPPRLKNGQSFATACGP